jgi:MoxR-like ATPase
MNNKTTGSDGDLAALQQLSTLLAQIRGQLGRVIVGQQEVIDQLLITMLGGGHALLVGVFRGWPRRC